MPSRYDADVSFSLEEFSRCGGLAGPHKDGWGIAYYADGDVRLMKEAELASDSACVRFIRDHPFSSFLVVSHIRKATQGQTTLRNCQPFVREPGGTMHVFAHNSHLERGRLHALLALDLYRPVGETDSEYAFCAMLERLRGLWLDARGVPPLEERFGMLAEFARSALRIFSTATAVRGSRTGTSACTATRASARRGCTCFRDTARPATRRWSPKALRSARRAASRAWSWLPAFPSRRKPAGGRWAKASWSPRGAERSSRERTPALPSVAGKCTEPCRAPRHGSRNTTLPDRRNSASPRARSVDVGQLRPLRGLR